ncbi:MAG: NUDIX hydrolase [Paracoccaceae bacterium]
MADVPKLAALAVVVRGNELLLVRRRNEPDAGLWGLPGGHVDWGESIGVAACRELFEETTVKATPGRSLIGLDTIISDEAGNTQFHYYMVAVECIYMTGEPTARDDVFDANWISHDDIRGQQLPLSEDVDTVLNLALQVRR